MKIFRIPVVFISLAYCAVLQAQDVASKQSPKGSISGTVIDKATGQPLKKATVQVRKAQGGRGGPDRFQPPEAATTGIDGRFSLRVEEGEYRLLANRNGYVRQAYGQKDARRPGTILTVASGQEIKDINFQLVPGGVIAGRVVDEDGEPVSGVMVQALRPTYSDGERRLENAGGTARTDDRGEYRIFGLPAHRYYLSATRRGGGDSPMMISTEEIGAMPSVAEGYATVYFPGTTDSAFAGAIEVRAAEEQRVNFTLIPTRVFKVSGRVVDASGQPVKQGFSVLFPRSGGMMMPNGFAPVQNGTFEVRGVTPGSYTLMAGVRDEETESARRDVDVGDADISNLNLTLSPGAEIHGSIRFVDLSGKQPDALNIMLIPMRQAGFFGLASASARADGSFTLKNVFPEDYMTSVSNIPRDAFIKSVKVGGEETATSGFNGAKATTMEIVISGRGATIKGSVTDADGKPFAGATVVLTSDRPIRNRRGGPETTSTDQYGHFAFHGLRPASYHVGAWQDIDEEEYLDPEFAKRQSSRLTAVKLGEGESQTRNLSLAPLGEREVVASQ